jgi:hypothetical protein
MRKEFAKSVGSFNIALAIDPGNQEIKDAKADGRSLSFFYSFLLFIIYILANYVGYINSMSELDIYETRTDFHHYPSPLAMENDLKHGRITQEQVSCFSFFLLLIFLKIDKIYTKACKK